MTVKHGLSAADPCEAAMTATNPTHAAEVLPPQMVRQADNPTPQAEARAGDGPAAAGREGVGALVSSTWHRTRSALSVTVAGALIAGLFLIANSSFNRNFDGLEASIGLTNARIGDTNARIDRVEVRMGRLEVKVDALDDRMDRLEVRMGRLEVRMGRLEVKVDALDDRMDGMAADISAVLDILIERGGAGAVPEAGAAGLPSLAAG